MDTKTIKTLILEAIPDAVVRVDDVRGDGIHYALNVTAASFDGKTRLEQHRMIYAALKPVMSNDVNALTVQTFVPERRARS